MKDINYALVEEKRPAIYTSLKYWGKKPHNIWRKYIENYTAENGIYLDPFSGSAMSAFEAFKAGRKSIAFDINPLTSFIIETFSSDFDRSKFIEAANKIIDCIERDENYNTFYKYKIGYTLQNSKWVNGTIYECCFVNENSNSRIASVPTNDDFEAAKNIDQVEIKGLFPNKKFRNVDVYSESFKKMIGDSYDDLYTCRNLYTLALIFNEITKIDKDNIKKQLLFSFIQIVHLSTKMCSPRSKETNRDFSTSWGRPAFLGLKKQMEMNPLLLFKNSCFGKQSTLKTFECIEHYFNRRPIIRNINSVKYDEKLDVDIWYGVVDIAKINEYLPQKSIDFVLTDPPYGGLIRYLDLSSIWLSWLELIDKKYSPDYHSEITISSEKTVDQFKKKFTEGLINIYNVLKDNGKIVLTFNNKDIKIWDIFLSSISDAGFYIEKVIHQQNKRTGESNVTDPYGTSATDFYIRCCKKKNINIVYKYDNVEEIIVEYVKNLISERKEPTPFQIIFNGLLATLSSKNVDLSTFDDTIKNVLDSHLNKDFIVYNNSETKAGDYWWLNNVKYDSKMPDTLTNKITRLVKREIKIGSSEDSIIQKVFINFPNGMSPDLKTVKNIIKREKNHDGRKIR